MNSNYISFEQFKETPAYASFLAENPSQGILKVQVFLADQAIPIANTRIFITKQIDGQDVLFFEGVTDSSGIIDNILLPAPAGDYNVENFEIPKYTTYRLVASNDLYKSIKQYEISMFGDVKVLQYIKMSSNEGGQL